MKSISRSLALFTILLLAGAYSSGSTESTAAIRSARENSHRRRAKCRRNLLSY